ncbi:hypothetical protein BGY98DRAFT_1098315 [Russula aff. rugulosa BPL654]|nr:hypothetical protein BGY98DRAFT_1098315 [Russula aff. rugulosa BPL654]
MSKHIKATAIANTCECPSIVPSQTVTIRKFWEALTSVVHGSYDRAESVLCLVQDRQDPQVQTSPTTSPSSTFEVSDANIIIRSSDLVDFRVHKSPSDSETFDGLPVVDLSEDSELLNSLVSILYPVPTVIPSSYEKVLYLLAACQKYDMVSVQSLIRAEVSRGEFPAPKGPEAFSAYVIASSKGLIPEMENAARQTLEHPMTFEIFGEGLRSIEGWALRDLANFRKRCRNNLSTSRSAFIFQPDWSVAALVNPDFPKSSQ